MTVEKPYVNRMVRVKQSIITIVASLFLFLAIPMVGQASIEPAAVCGGSAQIPFDFWIGGSRLPAGQYRVECIIATVVVLFHNADKNVHQQAFLIPTSDEVAIDDYKLVFTVHAHQHYMQELWNSNGKAVLTSRFGMAMAPEDTRIEIPMDENQPGKQATGNGSSDR